MSVPPRRRPVPGPVPPRSVLVVCTGNICRSPFAAGALRVLAPHLEVSSAGTHALEGSPIDPPMARELRARGGDPSAHRARQVLPADLRADLVLVMSARQRRLLLDEHPGAVSRIVLLGAVGGLDPAAGDRADAADIARWARRRPDPASEIADPYRQGDEVAAQVAERLWQDTSRWAALLAPASPSTEELR